MPVVLSETYRTTTEHCLARTAVAVAADYMGTLVGPCDLDHDKFAQDSRDSRPWNLKEK